jgi:hypothetical protein
LVSFEDIKDFPNYMINKKGQVYSKKLNLMMMPDYDYEYPRIHLVKNKKSINKLIHRLVAIQFIPNPDNKSYIDHIDGNKENFTMNNLRWITRSENMIEYYKNKQDVIELNILVLPDQSIKVTITIGCYKEPTIIDKPKKKMTKIKSDINDIKSQNETQNVVQSSDIDVPDGVSEKLTVLKKSTGIDNPHASILPKPKQKKLIKLVK